MRRLVRALSIAGLMFLAACSGQGGALPPPLEPDENAIAYFCGMSLPEHEGPKGQAFVTGRDEPYWFASAREAFQFVETDLQSRDLRVLYVNDMSKGTWEKPAPGAWIDIHKAFFVIGSSKTAAMSGNEPVPFATMEAAQAFSTQYGGEIVDFDATVKMLAIDQAGAGG